LVIAVLFCVIFVSDSTRHTYDVPFAAWSGTEYFKGQNVGVSQLVVPDEVESLLLSFFHLKPSGLLSQYVTNDQYPELVVLFTEAQLRSEQLATYASSLLQFKSIMKDAPSSLYAPFVDLQNSFDSSVDNIAYSAKRASGKVFYFGKGSPLLQDILSRVPTTIVAGSREVKSTLNKNSDIFSNGVVDLIIIYLPTLSASLFKFSDTDETISDVNSLISAKTSNYVCAYTALAYDNPEYNLEFGGGISTKRYLSFHLQSTADANNYTNETVPIFRQFFGGWFWELFVVMLILIPLLIIGTYAIDSIQTPLFEARQKTKNN